MRGSWRVEQTLPSIPLRRVCGLPRSPTASPAAGDALWQNTHVAVGNTASLQSGDDTMLAGIIVSGTTVWAYAGHSGIDSDYASVNEGSGIEAGDGGFQISVANNTALTGGVIASTQQPVDSGANTFSTGGTLTATDIQRFLRVSVM
ncbi:hemagglutinin repeat-containing protein [Variovorax sp. VNK109]|uniref:hemagglutinin repeat-containing protein n=1 Tax=Variovorax sp. VNK109 TaxID=3400919 RepID=UPI003C10B2CA